MENTLQKSETQNQLTFTTEQVKLIKDTVAKGTTDNEFNMFLYQAQKTGLDPLARQIYVVVRSYTDKQGKPNRNVTIQSSIDGLRVVAERTGKYEGQTKPEWCGADGKWVDVWLSNAAPVAARVGVYKKGFREALYGVAKLSSYKPDFGMLWNKMPEVMLSKCAEALAMRKAFPQDLSGIYTSEEMEQADRGDVEPIKSVPASSNVPEDLKEVLTKDASTQPLPTTSMSEEEFTNIMEGEVQDANAAEKTPDEPKITVAQIAMLGRYKVIDTVKAKYNLESLHDLSRKIASAEIDSAIKAAQAAASVN